MSLGRGGSDPCIQFALSDKVRDFVDVLRFIAKTRRYSILDRLGFTLDPRVAEESIEEALRLARTSIDSALVAEVKRDSGTETISCCDYERPEGGLCPPGYEKVSVERVVSGPREYEKTVLCCARCPRLPSDEVMRKVIECIYSNVRDFTRILVARALSWG